MTTTEARARKPRSSNKAAAVLEDLEQEPGRHTALWIGLGAGALTIFGLVALSRSVRRARRRQALWQTAALLLGQGRPERPAPQPDGFIKNALKQAGTSLIALTTQELGRRALKEWAPAEEPAEERTVAH